MFKDLLPDNVRELRIDDLNQAARQSTKSGNFEQAAAILANGYDRGGPAVFLDQAYTYAHYIIISRRMLRRGVDALNWERGKDILENFSSLHGDVLTDRLETEFATKLKSCQGSKREPSGAMLLAAELRLANGEEKEQIVEILPQSKSVEARRRIVEAQACRAVDDRAAAKAAIDGVLVQAPRNQDALELSGRLALADGDLQKAADCFDKNLRSVFAPVPDVKIPAGEIHYRSTVLNRFEIYAYSDGFFVVKKQSGLIGVTMVGRQILQVMETPGYRQWLTLKELLSRFIRIERLRAVLLPSRANGGDSDGGSGIGKILYRIYDRVMVKIGAEPIRPYIKRAGLAVYPALVPFLPAAKFVLRKIANVLRLLRKPGKSLSRGLYRLVMLKWIKAREVPDHQMVAEADDIFAVVNRMLEEEERAPEGIAATA